ncbi:hypothetical protein NDU88_007600 [Pleurodeles waltl]|uniref:Uncharacterized protein n=1 Tax=Pleurodeles waltl TaxID=8319 RepID=A0AAV7QPL0_PLEWA|nr:hypothetical protein NDU88_007600 [Pleurodeles waltl]
MPTGKPHDKSVSKSSWQLLFSEALQLPRFMAAAGNALPFDCSSAHPGSTQDTAMARFLQEIMAMGHRLEELDSVISALTAKTKSISLVIAGFQNHVTDLEQHVSIVESHLCAVPDRDPEHLFLCSKLIDLEDRS